MGQLAGIAVPKEFEKAVKDFRASIEKLRRDAVEAALIRDRATDHASARYLTISTSTLTGWPTK
jgi:hypothetical protein